MQRLWKALENSPVHPAMAALLLVQLAVIFLTMFGWPTRASFCAPNELGPVCAREWLPSIIGLLASLVGALTLVALFQQNRQSRRLVAEDIRERTEGKRAIVESVVRRCSRGLRTLKSLTNVHYRTDPFNLDELDDAVSQINDILTYVTSSGIMAFSSREFLNACHMAKIRFEPFDSEGHRSNRELFSIDVRREFMELLNQWIHDFDYWLEAERRRHTEAWYMRDS